MQHNNLNFEQLCDIMAFRLIVPTQEDCYRGLGIVHGAYPVHSRPLQGLHLDAEAERLPLAAHRRVRSGAPAHRGADPHPRDARDRRVRRRRALALQAGDRPHQRPAVPLAARTAGDPGAHRRRRGVPRAHQAGDVPGRGVLLHAEGRPDQPADRRHARSTSPTPCTRRSATSASAPRSTAG